MSSPRLLRQSEALQVVEGIDRPELRRVARLFYGRVVRRFARGTHLPTTDFDLLYFIEGILRFCSMERTINAISNGADLRWDDDDDKRNVTSCPLPEWQSGEPSHGWTWIARSHEADWYRATIQDLALHQLVQLGTFAIARGPTQIRFEDELPTSNRTPDVPIDMFFCAEILFDICRLKQHIGRSHGSAKPI